VPTPIENGGGGMNVHAIAGGSDYKFSDGLRHVYRCQVINYESVTVTDISMDLHLTFQEVIQVGDNPNNQRSGEVTLARSWPITIAKIDPGPQNPFVFYIFSATRHFVYVRFPAGATARRIGENTPMMLPVNSTSTAPMSFGPQNL
jgi:hypothetical protein